MDLSILEKLVDREADVFDNLSEKGGRDVTALVERNRGAPASTVAELLVGTALSDLHKPMPEKNSDNLGRLEYRDAPHRSGNNDCLDTHELRGELRLSVLEQQLQNFLEIRIKFIKTASLRVGARKTGNVPNEQASLRVTLDHCGEVSHSYISSVSQQADSILRRQVTALPRRAMRIGPT